MDHRSLTTKKRRRMVVSPSPSNKKRYTLVVRSKDDLIDFSTRDPTRIRKPGITESKMAKDGLSNDQVSSMKEAFTLFDTDGDGKIAPSELGILMRSLGVNPTESQLKSIIATENLSSPFDFNRFLDLMAKHLKTEPFDRQLRDAFKVLDKEGTGFVAVADLRHILTSIGEKLQPSEFDEWIKEVDVGSDGKIRYEDFIARMVAK